MRERQGRYSDEQMETMANKHRGRCLMPQLHQYTFLLLSQNTHKKRLSWLLCQQTEEVSRQRRKACMWWQHLLPVAVGGCLITSWWIRKQGKGDASVLSWLLVGILPCGMVQPTFRAGLLPLINLSGKFLTGLFINASRLLLIQSYCQSKLTIILGFWKEQIKNVMSYHYMPIKTANI